MRELNCLNIIQIQEFNTSWDFSDKFAKIIVKIRQNLVIFFLDLREIFDLKF